MLFTKASEYALFALIYLADHKEAVGVEKISSELALSKSFLAKVLQNLAKEEIVISYKGANGGFILAKEPSNLSLKEILSVAENSQSRVFDCTVNECYQNQSCKIWYMFSALQKHIDNFLEDITLEDILKGEKF